MAGKAYKSLFSYGVRAGCASLAAIPVVFTTFGVAFNPAAQTRRSPQCDRADKRPLTLAEMKAYWKLIADRPGIEAAVLRLHLLTDGQRIEQFIRLRWADVGDDAMTLFDGKGRPSQGPRSPQVPLVSLTATELKRLEREGEYVFSTTKGKKPHRRAHVDGVGPWDCWRGG